MDFDEFVALKIVRAAKEYAGSAKDEIRLCEALRGCQGCIQLYDKFVIKGPNGRHLCIVFELAGDNLLTLIRKYQKRGQPMPDELIKQICRDVLTALYEMESRGLIHTDLKPENILLTRYTKRVKRMVKEYIRPSKKRNKKGKRIRNRKRPKINVLKIKDQTYKDSFVVKLADFGNACWIDKHFSTDIQTRQYRAPEVILGQGYGPPTDLWSFACVVFELITFDFLLNPKGKKGCYSKNEDHLAQMIELLGPIDPYLANTGKYAIKYFDDDGNLLHINKLKYWDLKSLLMEKYNVHPDAEAHLLSDFLKNMLRFNPNKRALPEELLLHPWLAEGYMNPYDQQIDYNIYFYKYYRDYY